MKKSVNTYLDESTMKAISATFETTYQGLRLTTESFFVLRNYAQKELRGLFTGEELSALVNMFNATMFEPGLASAQVLKATIEDAQRYEGAVSLFDADPESLLAKIDMLSDNLAFWIMFECNNFWYSPGERDLEEFLKRFV